MRILRCDQIAPDRWVIAVTGDGLTHLRVCQTMDGALVALYAADHKPKDAKEIATVSIQALRRAADVLEQQLAQTAATQPGGQA